MSTHYIVLGGTITSPVSIGTSDIILLSNSLVTITPDHASVQRTDRYTYYYYIQKTLDISIVDTIYFLRILNNIFPANPVSYNAVSNFNYSIGTIPISFTSSWMYANPIFFASPSILPTITSYSSPTGLTFTESNTALVVDSGTGKNVVDWNSLSTGTISADASTQVSSGILFSFLMKKKNTDLINTNLVTNTSNYNIDIGNDTIYVDPLDTGTFYGTALTVTVNWQLLSIWIGTNQIKTWLNNVAKDTINFSGSNTPTVNNCIFQFFGYLEKYCIIKTASPDITVINNLFVTSGLLSSY